MTTSAIPRDHDLLGSGTDLGREQLEHLDMLLDEHSIKALTATGIRQGLRCLEIGAGSGSIARWMAGRVQPEGGVVALDLDTDRLTAGWPMSTCVVTTSTTACPAVPTTSSTPAWC